MSLGPCELAIASTSIGCSRRMGEGGFATVFSAQDTIEDRKVALKIPDSRYVTNHAVAGRHAARGSDHGAVGPSGSAAALKDARFIDGHFVMVFPLGEETLGGSTDSAALAGDSD